MEITKYGLKALQVDAYGLDEMDNKILTTMIDKFKGGPVGIIHYQLQSLKMQKQLRKFMSHFLFNKDS